MFHILILEAARHTEVSEDGLNNHVFEWLFRVPGSKKTYIAILTESYKHSLDT